MKQRFGKIFFFLTLLGASGSTLLAEVVYTKDGQIYNGDIVKEDKTHIWVKTKYLTKQLARDQILRVLYGERELEQIYIQLKDDRIISGYMVDQDNTKVIIRIEKDSKDETTILKSNIARMSAEKIVPLEPDFVLAPGYYSALNTDSGAKLEPAIQVQLGMGIAIPALRQLRLSFLLGYLYQSADFYDTKEQQRTLNLQSFPLGVQAMYGFSWYNLFFYKPAPSHNLSTKEEVTGSEIPAEDSKITLEDTKIHWSQSFEFVTGLTLGTTFMIFDNGEGESFSGLKLLTEVLAGIRYEVLPRKFYLSLLANQQIYIENTGSVLLELGAVLHASYRY